MLSRRIARRPGAVDPYVCLTCLLGRPRLRNQARLQSSESHPRASSESSKSTRCPGSSDVSSKRISVSYNSLGEPVISARRLNHGGKRPFRNRRMSEGSFKAARPERASTLVKRSYRGRLKPATSLKIRNDRSWWTERKPFERRLSLKEAMSVGEHMPREERRPFREITVGNKDTPVKDAVVARTLPQAARVGEKSSDQITASELQFEGLNVPHPPVPVLAHGLDRVLFNPGVYHLRDPRSRVYNFDPYLEKVLPVTEFDFDALSQYVTSSEDQTLRKIAQEHGSRYAGSTSSMSHTLAQFHFLISQWRRLNTDMFSRGFEVEYDNFTYTMRAPVSIYLRWKDGTYAIDADKDLDDGTILSMLGKSMEKLFTNSKPEFERFRKSNASQGDREVEPEAFHYSTSGKFLMRSQLDAYDPRLPGSGIFDLKTRAVVTVRTEPREYELHSGYQIRAAQGKWESFEREYFDMARATLMKYSLQVRMGRMDGIFVGFHNVERLFGFQYITKSEMDLILHAQTDPALGDQEFLVSLELLGKVFDRVTTEFPQQSIRLHFDTRDTKVPFMYVWAEPVTEEEADASQNAGKQRVLEYERQLLGLDAEAKQWSEIEAEISAELKEGDQEQDRTPATKKNGKNGRRAACETDEDSSEPADIEQAKSTESDELSKPLLGFVVTVQNCVNGRSVIRPENLTGGDEWTIDYTIGEIIKHKKSLYEQCKARRRKALEKKSPEELEKDKYLNSYLDRMRFFSRKGRTWREAQDKLDEKVEPVVYQPMDVTLLRAQQEKFLQAGVQSSTEQLAL